MDNKPLEQTIIDTIYHLQMINFDSNNIKNLKIFLQKILKTMPKIIIFYMHVTTEFR
jgi:hypothetical protein